MTDNISETPLEIVVEQFINNLIHCPAPDLSIGQLEHFYEAIFNTMLFLGNELGRIDEGSMGRIVRIINEAKTQLRLTLARKWLDRTMLSTPADIGYIDDKLANSVRFLYARGEREDIELLERIAKSPALGKETRGLAEIACEKIAERYLGKAVDEWIEAYSVELSEIPKGTWLALDGEKILARNTDYKEAKSIAEGKEKLFVMYQV